MRIFAIAGAAAALFCLAGSSAEAARWCAGAECAFRSHAQCVRAVGARGGCHRQAAARVVSPAGPFMHGPVPASTAGPPWKSPYECYFDEGYGRYNPCSTGGGGGRP